MVEYYWSVARHWMEHHRHNHQEPQTTLQDSPSVVSNQSRHPGPLVCQSRLCHEVEGGCLDPVLFWDTTNILEAVYHCSSPLVGVDRSCVRGIMFWWIRLL